MLMSGEAVRAKDAAGWLIDAAATLNEALAMAWSLASGKGGPAKRPLEAAALEGVPVDVPSLAAADTPARVAGRVAIARCVAQSCALPLADALTLQALLAAEFLTSKPCREGRVGAEWQRTMQA